MTSKQGVEAIQVQAPCIATAQNCSPCRHQNAMWILSLSYIQSNIKPSIETLLYAGKVGWPAIEDEAQSAQQS